MSCSWRKEDGHWICQARECHHWTEDGCELGKVSLSCDNSECRWHVEPGNRCMCMDVHLDADGKCLASEKVAEIGKNGGQV